MNWEMDSVVDKGKERFKSITMDNGTEFLNFTEIESSFRDAREKRTVCYKYGIKRYKNGNFFGNITYNF